MLQLVSHFRIDVLSVYTLHSSFHTVLPSVQETQEYAGKCLQLYSKIRSSKALQAWCVVIPSESSGGSVQLHSGDISWDTFVQPALSQPHLVLAFEPAHVAPHTIMNVLFSSGTTGAPKAIPWPHTTPFRCVLLLFCTVRFGTTTQFKCVATLCATRHELVNAHCRMVRTSGYQLIA